MWDQFEQLTFVEKIRKKKWKICRKKCVKKAEHGRSVAKNSRNLFSKQMVKGQLKKLILVEKKKSRKMLQFVIK